MERKPGGERPFQKEREQILTAWNRLGESGAAGLLVALEAREHEAPGQSHLRAIIKTPNPEWFYYDLRVNPEGVATELTNAQCEESERTAVLYQLTFNSFSIPELPSGNERQYYDRIGVDADASGALIAFHIKNNGRESYLAWGNTYESTNMQQVAKEIHEDLMHRYRRAKYIPQPRKGR